MLTANAYGRLSPLSESNCQHMRAQEEEQENMEPLKSAESEWNKAEKLKIKFIQ